MFRIGGGSSKVLPSYTIDLEQVKTQAVTLVISKTNTITLLLYYNQAPFYFLLFKNFGTET